MLERVQQLFRASTIDGDQLSILLRLDALTFCAIEREPSRCLALARHVRIDAAETHRADARSDRQITRPGRGAVERDHLPVFVGELWPWVRAPDQRRHHLAVYRHRCFDQTSD